MSLQPWIEYSEEIGDKICDLIAESNVGLKTIIKNNPDLPSFSTIFRWLDKYETFRNKYARAREIQADYLADEIIEISDFSANDTSLITDKNGNPIEIENKEWINRSRLRVDARKWIASKLKPKKYGDKIDVDHTSKGEQIPIIIDWTNKSNSDAKYCVMEAIKITPTDKQKEARKLLQKNKMVLYGGAIRGSKSFWGCMEITTLCFQYPNSRWLLLRESWGNIEGKLLVTFTENFLNKGFYRYVVSFNKQTYTLTWSNGSQIVFMAESYNSDKELNRFRGLEINGAFIDEVNEIQESTFNKIIERTGSWFHSKNCPSKILMSCNPTNGWVKERFYNPWKENKLPEGIAYIQAKITDNPYVSKEYIETLKLLPRYEYEVFVEGNWDIQLKTGGEFLRAFELDKHVKHLNVDHSQLLHISIDSNVYPYITISVFQLEKVVDKWIIKQVYEIDAKDPNNTAKRAAELLAKWINSIGYLNTKIYLYGDKSTKARNNIDDDKRSFAQIFTETLVKNKINVVDKFATLAPSVASLGDFVNAILDGSQSWGEIQISENCKSSISDYIETKTDRDGTILKKRITDPKTGMSYEPHGHRTDALKDFLYQAFTDKYKLFQNRFNLPTNGVVQIKRTGSVTF